MALLSPITVFYSDDKEIGAISADEMLASLSDHLQSITATKPALSEGPYAIFATEGSGTFKITPIGYDELLNMFRETR